MRFSRVVRSGGGTRGFSAGPLAHGKRPGAGWRTLTLAGLALCLGVSTVSAGSSKAEVMLRSGAIKPGRQAAVSSEEKSGTVRRVVRFRRAPDSLDRGRLQAVGARVDASLPNQAYLVSVPASRAAELSSVPGVDWSEPYLMQDKIAPEIAAVTKNSADDEDVIVLLHLFSDVSAAQVAGDLEAAGLRVQGARNGGRFGRIVVLMTPEEVESQRDVLAERNDVFWVGRRYKRTLANDDIVWVDQSGLDAGSTTPIFSRGLHGEGQIAAVLDTGLDADACFYRDDALGLPPTNTGTGTTTDPNQRKVIAVDFLDPNEDPSDPTHWDTQGHGTHVAGTLVGDDLANPIVHDTGDGLAPGAQVVIQDAGYAADNCGDLPGIGCPVTDLVPVFQQAYDQGARVHNNSWNDNENAAVQNTYTDASEDVDEFVWNNPDFLILFGAGNNALGGYGTMGSPGTCKNGMSVGATYNAVSAIYLSDISAWGPTDDGRIKPDVLSPGASIQSASNDGNVTTNNCATNGSTGTSHASPGAGGGALLIRQYFVEGFYPSGAANAPDGFNPTAALVKAMLINSATPIEFDAEGRPIVVPGVEQGWGRILLDDAMHFSNDVRELFVDENTNGFSSSADAPITYMLDVQDVSEPLKVTLVWSDYPSTPAATTHLVNDLDLRVDGPGGGWWGNAYRDGASWDLGQPDRLNNVEQVLLEVPDTGVYSITITPQAIPQGPQPFALVVTGGGVTVTMGPRPSYILHAVDDSGPNGNGDGVLDPGETAILPITLRNSGDADAQSVLGDLFSGFPSLLKVYEGTASYADMVVGAQETSISPHYEVTLDPSAICGQWLGANMGIAGDGFSVGSGFTMNIGVYEGDSPSTDTPIAIPKDNATGIYSYLDVPTTFPVTEVDVTVNIDHGDISELRVVLYSPDNTITILHDHTGAGVSGLHTTYDELTQPAQGSMDNYIGLDPQGTWKLRVIDDVGGGTQVGDLLDWTLHFESDIPYNCNPVGCSEGVPTAVGDTLMADRSGSEDVALTWTGVGESEYHVWHSGDPEFMTAAFAGPTGGATSFTDVGAQTAPTSYYYLVRSANVCGWESP